MWKMVRDTTSQISHTSLIKETGCIPKVPGSNPGQGGILFKAMLAYTYPN